jgi:acyl-CoA dehydrogenase
MVKVAQDKLSQGANGHSAFYENKLATARFFMDRLMPETAAHLARISSGADSMMTMNADAF